MLLLIDMHAVARIRAVVSGRLVLVRIGEARLDLRVQRLGGGRAEVEALIWLRLALSGGLDQLRAGGGGVYGRIVLLIGGRRWRVLRHGDRVTARVEGRKSAGGSRSSRAPADGSGELG